VYPRRAGNLVTPWIDGVPFYDRLRAAIRAARSGLWAIVSFIDPSFRFLDGTSWWELLDEAAARGLDVRVLFWRNPSFFNTRHVFLGTPADRAFLATRRGGWSARWDTSAEPAHCHHQKAFVIDAGAPDAIAFVGGMVLSHSTLAHPGHATGLAKHDAFVELQGPSVHDAIANFVERWNLAREDPSAPPWPSADVAGPLALPPHAPPPLGSTDVQLCRTIRPGDYGSPGEASILAHYRDAFASARRTIYLENQHPGEPSLLAALDEALRRGVHVVMVVPGEPMPAIIHASREVAARLAAGDASHRYASAFRGLAGLAAHPSFTLVALARSDATRAGWSHREIYVHAKLCIVDGAWATLGSANFVDLSLLPDHTELNATFWGESTCLPLLRQLVLEHTNIETSDDLSALTTIAAHARAGAASRAAGGPIHGCYAIDPTRYGQDPPSSHL
jgi:phosphatidylserine/phosphatidylglycerophosphate/cardiolipin synthase-like enzyme